MSLSTISSAEHRCAGLFVGILLFTLIAAPIATAPGAAAKTPGKTYCYNRICHRVLTLAETRRAVGRRHSLIASYYSHCKVDRFNPCGLTSSGAKFRPGHADNAASPIYPNGTKLLVWNPSNKRAAVIRIDNAGPYWRNRTLDLSRAAAQRLGFRHRGVARLVVQVLKAPTRRQARYRRHRRYAPVKGYLGRFASLTNALNSTRRSPRTTILAKVALPVQNIYMAERRIWLARLVETGPVSVTLAKRPSLRLPVRLARAEFFGFRNYTRPGSRKVAALTTTPPRSTRSKKKRVTRSRQQPPKVLQPTKTKTATPNKPRRKTNPAKRVAVQSKVGPTQPPKTASDTPAQKKQSPAENATTTQPRPKMVWRREILGTGREGA